MPKTGTPSRNRVTVEICYVLIGQMRDDQAQAKMMWRKAGGSAHVNFDGAKVLDREESHGDVIGFYHTHPEGFVLPSDRDDRTMAAWCFAFGKPLICAIATRRGIRAWRYHVDGRKEELAEVSVSGRTQFAARF